MTGLFHAHAMPIQAAGIAYIDPDGSVLLLKRSPDSDHAGEWCFPGGHIDEGETADYAARRESSEEIGRFPYDDLEEIARVVNEEGVDFSTFACGVDEQFEPTLNDEHTDYIWAPVNKLPDNTHPGVIAVLTKDCACNAAKPARAHTRDGITSSGLYTTEQIGVRQSITPEGFLLCEGVPIARVGSQDYAYFELPSLEAKDGVIVADRTADVLFSPETLASFEGKPVTIEHPSDFVNPRNYMAVARGTVRNVRRGEGEQSDLMLADLLITDAEAIRRVQSKDLTQVSNGYDAEYEQIAPGRARQATIVGNHVALVKNARCGPVCSIGDNASNLLLTGDSSMAKKKPEQSTLLAKLRKAFMTRDSDTFEQVANEMTSDEDGDDKGVPAIHIHMPGADKPNDPAATTDDDPAADPANDPMAKCMAAIESVAQAVAAIGERVAKLEAGKTTDADPDADPDDDPTKTGDADPDADPDSDPEDKPTMTADSATFRDEFQDAMARAEILAPGVKLPTFDSKAPAKKTSDSLCVLRRRALRAAGDNEHADLVKSITGGGDISKMTCDSVKTMFIASSEVVKQKNLMSADSRRTQTADGGGSWAEAQNKRNADFWANRK